MLYRKGHTNRTEVKHMTEKYLTSAQFAARIGVHRHTVRAWRESGKLRPHHYAPSGRALYSEEQVEKILTSRDGVPVDV